MSEPKSYRVNKEELRFLYNDIIFGFTQFDFFKNKKCYIKHLTPFDSAKIDQVTLNARNKAHEMGLNSEKEQLQFLDEEGLWSEKDEKDYEELKGYIRSLHISKKKLLVKDQVEVLEAQIQEAENNLLEKLGKRTELVGFTSESYASKKTNEYYVYISLYKDEKFAEPFYSEEEYDALNQNELELIVAEYNKITAKFADESVKRIALSGFFLNFFYVSNDNPYYFYGKPVVELTFYQLSLFSQGIRYKNMLQNAKHKPPEELFDDPDKLTEFFERGEEAMKAMESLDAKGKNPAGGKEKAGGATSLVGATKEQLKDLGMGEGQGEYVSLSKEASKKGGKLDIYDLMKIHNVK